MKVKGIRSRYTLSKITKVLNGWCHKLNSLFIKYLNIIIAIIHSFIKIS